MMTAALISLLTLAACGASDIDAPPSDDNELGDAFGSSGSTASSSPIEPTTAVPVSDAAVTSHGGCAVTVSGDYTTTITQGTASSDHWLGDEEVAEALLDAENTPGTSAAVSQPSVEGAAPVFNWLVISCGDSEGQGFSLLANANATATDVPFGPGSYAITPGFLSGSEDRTQFSAIVDVGDGELIFSPTSGVIDITRFDASGVAGTVTMELEQSLPQGTPKRASLVGTFDLPCTGGAGCATT